MKNRRAQILIAFVISLLLHILFATFAVYFLNGASVQKPEEKIIEINLPKDQEWRIADIAPPEVEKRPEKAKHLGLHDSSVPEETVASRTERAPGRPETRGGKGMDQFKREVEGLSDSENMREVIRLPDKKKAERGSVSQMPEDFYPDYKRGTHTYINVMKHQDVAYFVRLKRVFKLAWDPTMVLMNQRMAGEVSRGRIRVVLGISIDPSGNLDELFVINSSGIAGYDSEAMRAVKASSPFSSPPQKFVDKDGILRISWSFIVYL